MKSNTDNLIPLNRRAKAAQRAIQRAGGFASGIARRKRKKTLDIFEALLSKKTIENGAEMTREEKLICNAIKKATERGDWRFIMFLAQLRGELVTKQEIKDDSPSICVLTDEIV